jgi:predicted transcriptional regulator
MAGITNSQAELLAAALQLAIARAAETCRRCIVLNALARLEKGSVDSRLSTVNAVQKTLTRAGVEFLNADVKGEGVRLRSPNHRYASLFA